MWNRRKKKVFGLCVVIIGFLPFVSFFYTSDSDANDQLYNGVDFDLLPHESEERKVDADRQFQFVQQTKIIFMNHDDSHQLQHPNEQDADQQEDQQQQQQILNRDEEDDIHKLLEQMEGDWRFWWISKRIKLLWQEFETEGRKLTDVCRMNEYGTKRRVLILPGVLQLTNFARPEVIRKGGPLGELMQWADLIAGCYALCHEVAIRTQFQSTIAQLRADAFSENNSNGGSSAAAAAGKGCAGSMDYIYTDIAGFRSLPEDVINAYRHKFRILDAFGTEAAYNDPEYAASHGTAINHWGMLNLRLRQFYTLYPHTPDNSFLGFVVSRSKLLVNLTKDDYSLIMGKEMSYLQGKRKVLQTIHEVFPLKATMPHRAAYMLPSGVQILGIIDSLTYQDLLSNAKVCVGLGDPVESPSVIEAIARGCVFLNFRRKGDRAKLDGKPTSRQVNSQVPYLEEYVGPPYVYTIDSDDIEGLRQTLQVIKKQKSQSVLPREFTIEGYLERLKAYAKHQDYCRTDHNSGVETIWPPVSALQAEMAPVKTSCKKACFDKGLVCEPVFFPILNSGEYLSNVTRKSCTKIEYNAEIYAPAYVDVKEMCSLQNRSQLFSCAGGELENVRRFCPCRDYKPFQIALCKQCT